MLAVAMMLDGYGRDLTAEQCGMHRQTLRDWVYRYNSWCTAQAERVTGERSG
jgi:hypothetical protein